MTEPRTSPVAWLMHHRRAMLLTALGTLLVAVVGCPLAYERLRFKSAEVHQVVRLMGGLSNYHHKHAVFPPGLQALRDEHLVFQGDLRAPASGWEAWDEHSGPEARYLPLERWDGKTSYVIVVQSTARSSSEFYLITSDEKIRTAEEAELVGVLERDDVLRAATSQPGRWATVPWRVSADRR